MIEAVGRRRSQVERLSQEIEELDGIKAALSSAVKALQEIERREQAERPSHVRTAFFVCRGAASRIWVHPRATGGGK